MPNSDILQQILQVTLENNKILKALQEDGIAISMPDLNNIEEEQNSSLIVKETKTKISSIVEDVIKNNSDITAWEDLSTNLIWEFKSNDRKNIIMSQMETNDYVDSLNIIEYSGFNDWRVPTLKELQTLLVKEKINFSLIKKPLSKNTNYSYWTSTKYDENFYMTVNFNTGKDLKSVKDNLDHVRCVRGELKK